MPSIRTTKSSKEKKLSKNRKCTRMEMLKKEYRMSFISHAKGTK
jgi:hypothetical protein